MIKINLLNSVTERHNGSAVNVEKKIASPGMRFALMAGAAAALFLLVSAIDIVSTQYRKANAETEQAQQEQIAKELADVVKEQKELEAKTKNIEARINAIKTLRDQQDGPSAVLQAITERIAMTPSVYLEAVDQKEGSITITGTSNDEAAVNQFGKSLEFSDGLFTNMSIDMSREGGEVIQAVEGAPQKEKPSYFKFIIKTGYAASKGGNPNAPTTAANAPAPGAPAPNGAPTAPPAAPQPKQGAMAPNVAAN